MAGLGNTVAKLLQQQKNWPAGLSDGLDQSLPPVRGNGLIDEVQDGFLNPGNLRMIRYIPQRVQDNPPLVVTLHGCTQKAVSYADGAGWIELADRYGFCLLMPEQRRANNPNLCFNWFSPEDTTRGSGEVQSIRHMIERTVGDYGIDRDRIFVTGLSAGGAMTSAMLATYPELFAGGAIIAGLPYQSAVDIPGAFQVMSQARTMSASAWAELVRSASTHDGPWPKVSIWHGTADQTVSPQNSTESAKQWSTLHGAGHKPDVVEQGATFTRRVWNDGSGNPAVEEYTVSGLGHGTPLATGDGEEHFGAAAPFLIEAGLSSSHHIAQFWGVAGVPTRSADWSTQPPSTARQALSSPETVATSEPEREARVTAQFDRLCHHAGRSDVGGIINRALKSAGLIK